MPASLPSATYRVQFHREFNFQRAIDILQTTPETRSAWGATPRPVEYITPRLAIAAGSPRSAAAVHSLTASASFLATPWPLK